VARAPSPANVRETSDATREFEGIIRNGVVELINGALPEGTRVQVRPKR